MEGRQEVAAADAGADLVARIGAGDREAEAEFVRRFQPGVRVLMRRHCRLGDPIVADLSQDVLMHVLERLRAGAIRDPQALPAYVQSTIVRTANSEYRRRPVTTDTTALDSVSAEASPLEDHAATQRASLLKRLLAQLPVARDREILARFYLSEEDRDDVCRALGIDTSHFHRVLHRARERFRELLDQAGVREV